MRETVTRWQPVAEGPEFAQEAARRILQAATASIALHGRFRIVLAGGTTPRPVYEALREADTDWDAWHVYFGDERCLPIDDPARNSRMAQVSLLDHVSIPSAQIHPMPAEIGAYKAASVYARELRGLGNFDMVVLGLGEDGHTASLFPGQYWGIEHDSRSVLPVFNAPKPPPERMTLSASRLSRAGKVLFLVAGESKRGAVEQWRAGKSLPAAAVKPIAGVDVLVGEDLLR